MARVPRRPRSCVARGFRPGGGRRGNLVRARVARAAGLALRRGGSAPHRPADLVRARRRERRTLVPLRRDAPAAAGVAGAWRRVRPARHHTLDADPGPAGHGRSACGLLGTPSAPDWRCLVALSRDLILLCGGQSLGFTCVIELPRTPSTRTSENYPSTHFGE